jgi:sugar/nucleoside kinase (ribokinase family)
MVAPIIATLGELLVEFVAEEPGTGHRRPARYAGPFPSGAPAIFIDQAARMGARALIAGAVGADAFGDVVAGRLGEAGVDLRLLRRVEGRPTGIAFVAYDGRGGREFVYTIAGSAAPDFPSGEEAVAACLAAGVEVVHVSGSSLGEAMRERIVATVEALLDRGVRLSLDPNLRPELIGHEGMAALRRLLGRASYVLPSDADAGALWPGEPFEVWAPRLLGAGALAVVLKRGAAGACAMVAGEEPAHVAGHSVPEVDPTGAGDCFGATFVTALASGAPLARALALANAAGALAVTRLGPMEGNAGPEEVERLLRA